MPDPGAKYVSLETFRRSGAGVRTPVWFVHGQGCIYVATGARSGKAKRIALNPSVRMAECSLRGGLRGGWEDGRAVLVSGDEARRALDARKSKYGLVGLLVGSAIGLKKVAVYKITPLPT